MKKLFCLLTLMLFTFTGSIHALVDNLKADDIVGISSASTTSIKANQWYVLYNQGRKAYAKGAANVSGEAPLGGSTVNDVYGYMIRFIESDAEGKYLIQNAEGNYYKDLTYNSNAGVDANQANAGKFTLGQISSGHWYLKGSTYIMDCNGSAIVGWDTSAPTTTGGNSDWAIYEVSTSSLEDLQGGALVAYQLLKGGLFRIYNRNVTSQFIFENTSHKASTQTRQTSASARMRQMWIIEHDEEGFSLRNAQTGEYLQDNYTCSNTKYYWKIQLSPNNTSDNDKYIILCHGTVEAGKKNCANLNGGSSGLVDWMYDNDKNSEWLLQQVESSEVDTATVKENLDNICKTGRIDLEAGKYYQFVSLNDGGVMTERISDSNIISQDADEKSWNQYWKLTQQEDGTYTIQNVYSSKYLIRKASSVSSACGGVYNTTTATGNSRLWNIAIGSYAWETTYNFIEPIKPQTGIAIKASTATSYNDLITTTAAQWIAKRVDLTDEQVAEAQEAYSENEILLKTSTTMLNTRLQKYFTDYSCTTLRDTYANGTDEELSQAMTEDNLPKSMIRMALKTKNESWGHREKEFRIYDYAPYSDPTKWNSGSLVGTSYQFSPQTGPTGISVKAGEIIVFYVGATPAASTTLEFSNVPGCNVYATRTALKRGVNVYVPNEDGFLYIHHTITSTTKKIADVKPITVHIEGGRVQGYFDITRGHTNEDWKDMKATLFQDEIVHLKSKYYQYNMHYKDLLKEITDKELDEVDTDGCPKGIQGTLIRWDQLVAVQHEVMGATQFYDRFNCMLSASSSSTGNPYASSYGTYYPGVGTIMNYDALTHGKENDNGGNYWCIAHETGHVHQNLYNMAGCTEVSNNNFSQINTWIQGSNTGRGGPWKVAQASFDKRQFWFEYDLWQRCRAYFQLWLYFHLQEHDTTFYPRLFDMFRKTPMTRSGNKNNPGSGTTDYLRFAKFACDVAQADLSEFFQFWGFFVPLDHYEVGDYSNSYFTTTQAEIDEAIAYMHKYPKKLGNILFIDERIKKYPADYPGMKPGTMRVATTAEATPGDASEVGETGMFTDFVDNPEYMQYSCGVSVATGKCTISSASGKGAVGFKVCDADHNMVYVSNTHIFYIPESIRTKPFYIKAALGDGTDRLLYDPKDISKAETALDAEDSQAYNPALPVFTLEGQPTTNLQSGKVYIQNGYKFRMK